MLKTFLTSSMALIGLSCVGCSDSATSSYNATVQGTVTIDGELAPGGTVTFTPVKKGPVAVGAIAVDGSYSLRIGQGTSSDPDHNKIPSGEYIATVEISGPPGETAPENEGGPKPAGPRLMADKYASQKTSDLKEKVTEGLNVIDLKLDGVWANLPEESSEDADSKADDKAASDSGTTDQAKAGESTEDSSTEASSDSKEADASTAATDNDAASSDDQADQKEGQP